MRVLVVEDHDETRDVVSRALVRDGHRVTTAGSLAEARASLAEGVADTVVLRVADTGPGVPADERTRVFQPFYRMPSVRAGRVPGHGVGLALVAHVARALGGSVVFEDAPAGAVLRVTLPPWRGG